MLIRVSAGVSALIGLSCIGSVWYSAGLRLGSSALVYLESGDLLIEYVSDTNYDDPEFLSSTWHPDPPPPCGIVRRSGPKLTWSLPGIHRVFNSAMGTWWLVRLPLWLPLVVTLGWVLHSWISGRRRGKRSEPAQGVNEVCAQFPSLTSRMRLRIGSVIVVGIVMVWIASGCYVWTFNYRGRFAIEADGGILRVYNDLSGVRDYWSRDIGSGLYRRDACALDWTVPHTASCRQSTYGAWSELNVPFWVVFLLAGVPTVIVWRRARLFPEGCCPGCGYSLTGNVSWRCQECAEPFSKISDAGP